MIEVAIPLEEINQESAREKSIRHGHPSTLHMWWARRPLATARAVIWSSLVDDPSSHPELFPDEESQRKERERLFGVLKRLVKWENIGDEGLLNEARREILNSTGGNPPALLDPFAGGGAIPLEAQRLGLFAYAHDLNPVAVMINKAMIEIPPMFSGCRPVNPAAKENMANSASVRGANGLAEDVRYYGEWIKRKAYEQIGHLYPTIKQKSGSRATVIAWLWARTAKCPNPACDCIMPLTGTYVLSKKKGHCAWVEPIREGNHFSFRVRNGLTLPKLPEPKKGRGASFVCPACGETTLEEYIKKQGKEGKLGTTLMAVVAEGSGGREYITPDAEHIHAANINKPEDYPDGQINYNPRDIRSQLYGMDYYSELFTNRQLTALTTFSTLISEAQKEVEKDAIRFGMINDGIGLSDGGRGAHAYGEAIGVYLTFVIDKMTNLSSSLVGWMNDRGAFRETFARQAIPMVWDFAEANVFSNSGGGFSQFLDKSLLAQCC